MLRALVVKEWKQLRGLRWAGVALGILMPFVLIAGAEAGRRGWLPFGSVSSYSVGTILVDAMWPLLLGLWGLLALLFSSQAFAGDRSNGTENFLLERPIPRRKIWEARLLASIASTLLLIAAHIAYWRLLLATLGDGAPAVADQAGWLSTLGSVALVVALGSIAGLAAAAFVRAPIQAVLMGLVLAIIPPALSMLLGGAFPHAGIARVPIGFFVPSLLLVGYVLASYRMVCRGEPAGRGRLRRGVVILSLFFLAVPVVFAITAPIAIRVGAKRDFIQGAIPAARGDRAAVVLTGWPESAWIVDLEKKKLTKFLPKPVYYAAWNSEGTRLAVIQSGHAFGRQLSTVRLELFDQDGRATGESIEFERHQEFLSRPVWAGEHLIVEVFRAGDAVLRVFSADLSRHRDIPVERPNRQFRLFGPIDDGSMFVYRLMSREPNQFALHRVNLDEGRFEATLIHEEEGTLWGSTRSLSPSGQFWLRHVGDPPLQAEVVDLTTGEVLPGGETLGGTWLDGDLWVRVVRSGNEKQILIGRPGEEATVIRTFRRQFVEVDASPDDSRLLVRVWAPPEEGESASAFLLEGQLVHTDGSLTALSVFDPAGSGWTDVLDRLGMIPQYPQQRVHWAGTETLALTGTGTLALVDLLKTEGADYLIGSP